MPFVAASASFDIVSFGSGLGLTGDDFSNLASALSEACATHFITPNTVTITLQGSAAGPGTVSSTGPISGIDPSSMSSAIISQLSSLGMTGSLMSNQCLAISQGIVKNFMLMGVTGLAAGVGIGSGTGKVVGLNPSALKSLLVSMMSARGLVGTDTTRWATGISNGICLYLNTAAIIPVAVSVGAVIPPPTGPVPALTSVSGTLI